MAEVPSEQGSFGFDMSKMSLQKYEPYMWIVAASSVAFALVFELCHRRFVHIDLTLQPDYGGEHHEQLGFSRGGCCEGD
eukprot:Skav206887  [mRNA]  locus=scaffold3287:113092:116425:- [translate_table: standard]